MTTAGKQSTWTLNSRCVILRTTYPQLIPLAFLTSKNPLLLIWSTSFSFSRRTWNSSPLENLPTASKSWYPYLSKASTTPSLVNGLFSLGMLRITKRSSSLSALAGCPSCIVWVKWPPPCWLVSANRKQRSYKAFPEPTAQNKNM